MSTTDNEGLPIERWNAGQDYVNALEHLGFPVEGAIWLQDDRTNNFLLALVTSMVDRVGSTEIYDTLFKAYDRAGTPRDLDPWMVSLFSPESFFRREIDIWNEMNPTAQGQGGVKIDTGVLRVLSNSTYQYRPAWVYFYRPQARMRDTKYQLKVWRKFTENVEQLAA